MSIILLSQIYFVLFVGDNVWWSFHKRSPVKEYAPKDVCFQTIVSVITSSSTVHLILGAIKRFVLKRIFSIYVLFIPRAFTSKEKRTDLKIYFDLFRIRCYQFR